MSAKKQLIEALQREGFTVKYADDEILKAEVTDSLMPGWMVRIDEACCRTGDTTLLLVSKDGEHIKGYGDNWKEALEDIFFMYHCMAKED